MDKADRPPAAGRRPKTADINFRQQTAKRLAGTQRSVFFCQAFGMGLWLLVCELHRKSSVVQLAFKAFAVGSQRVETGEYSAKKLAASGEAASFGEGVSNRI